jgi:DNA-binding transcriptional MerR regulator
MTLTIGKLASKYGISRTALLYYDKLGLVSPTDRGVNGYRFYTEEDQQRLRQVLLYRDIGVPLDSIQGLLTGENDTVHAILLRRLYDLSEELAVIKTNQLTLIGMIADNLRCSEALDDKELERILLSAGVDRRQAQELHCNLEHSAPEAHQRFLQALGFGDQEIVEIRERFASSKEYIKYENK